MSGNPLSTAAPWSTIAVGYAEMAEKMMRPFAARALELAAPGADARVLDVAAGPGTLSLLAAQQVSKVRALDFSTEMLEVLRRKATAAGVDNIDAVTGDGQQLPYGDGEFDAAFSMFGLMFFPDRSRGFAELHRVLRPGGVAVVSSWAPMDESPLAELIFRAMVAGTPAEGKLPETDMFSLQNPERFETEMRAGGFGEVIVQRHTVELTYPDSAALYRELSEGGAPMAVMRTGFDEAGWAARTALIENYLRENYIPGSPLATTAFLAVGRKD
ncbi:class I SAM-dependent methyltransferase [Nocardia stercoris]|uniref:Methyltransferase domain-containing protein n=1 Tax=Nocardia stercoris TaxID=2483361 RepID=A0A3M2L980_9NOCA|nr:methyltransferase domain-containing protein [Nocardia stercoris]RMI34162.1 methyltransferase domain-containing protein [Nocardia stercoris]